MTRRELKNKAGQGLLALMLLITAALLLIFLFSIFKRGLGVISWELSPSHPGTG